MIRNTFFALALGGCLCCWLQVTFANTPNDLFLETQTITIANPYPLEDFGGSLDTSDGLFISGAINSVDTASVQTGAAYIYRRSVEGWWDQVAKLTPFDGAHNDSFGESVGLSGNFAIVGARTHIHTSSGSGAAYIFHRATDTAWEQLNEFLAPVGTDNFGLFADMDGLQAVVSGIQRINLGPGPRGTRGLVNVYEPSGPFLWRESQRIFVGNQSLSFVHDVSINDGTLVVGASQRQNLSQPFSYLVEVYSDSPTGFIRTTTLSAPISPQDSWFGFSVALDQDRLIVGAPREATHGAAYIFERDANNVWHQTSRLAPSGVDQQYGFGGEVAINGDFAIINSTASPASSADGQVYVFKRDNVGGWTEVAKLVLSATNFNFGYSLAINDTQVLIASGLNAPGAVHVFSQVPEPAMRTLVWVFCITIVAFRRRNPSYASSLVRSAEMIRPTTLGC